MIREVSWSNVRVVIFVNGASAMRSEEKTASTPFPDVASI